MVRWRAGVLRTLASEVNVCVSVTLVDGLVLARSAFHHSLNYRSVVVLGKARFVSDPEQKMQCIALHLITDHAVPRRWAEVRGPNELELKQTRVPAMSLQEVSAKIRTGPPVDDEEDYSLPIWAGVLPLKTHLGGAISDDKDSSGCSAAGLVEIYALCRTEGLVCSETPDRSYPLTAVVG